MFWFFNTFLANAENTNNQTNNYLKKSLAFAEICFLFFFINKLLKLAFLK